MLTQAASRSVTNARAIATACSSLPVVTKITRMRWGVRAGISGSPLARQAVAQFATRASILERLAIVYEQHRHFGSKARFESRVAVYFNSPDARVEIRQFAGNHFFHLAAQLAVVACVENQLDHELEGARSRIGVL